LRRRVAVARNLFKAWLLLAVPTAAMAAIGWRIGDYLLALPFGGSVVLLAAALYWYADRIAMGMVGARELLPTEAPALHSAVEALSARARVIKPRLYLLSDAYPRALSAGRGAQGGAALAVSTGLSASRRRPSSKESLHTSSRISATAMSWFRRSWW
jgi:hypothetical protein